MKEDFSVRKCSGESNVRCYLLPLWYDLNDGARLSHGRSQIRAWYTLSLLKGQKNTTDDRDIRFRRRRGDERDFPPTGGNSSLIIAREKKTYAKMYRWRRHFCRGSRGSMIYCVVSTPISIYKIVLSLRRRWGELVLIYRHAHTSSASLHCYCYIKLSFCAFVFRDFE